MAYDKNYTGVIEADKPVGSEYPISITQALTEVRRVAKNDFVPVTITANTTLTNTHNLVLCNATTASITVTLPDITGMPNKKYTIKKIDSSANTVTITCFGTQTIEGNTSIVLSSPYDTVAIVSDNTTTIWKEIRVLNAKKVGNFSASQTPTANTIPVAGADGKIAAGWDAPQWSQVQNDNTDTYPTNTVNEWVDVPLMSINITPKKPILIMFSANTYTYSVAIIRVRLVIDGVYVAGTQRELKNPTGGTSEIYATISIQTIQSLSLNVSHTIKVQFYSDYYGWCRLIHKVLSVTEI